MKKFKTPIIICICIIIFAFIVTGYILYSVKYKVVELDSRISIDDNYKLTLYSIGQPDFPFGSAHGRILLTYKENDISQKDFQLNNDGTQITSDSWDIQWNEEYARVYLFSEERPEEQWDFYFNGEIIQNKEELTSPVPKPQPPKATLNNNGELILDISLGDYTSITNQNYKQYQQEAYLLPLYEWKKSTAETPFYGYSADKYYFTADSKINCMPSVTVFTPENGMGIYEILLTFDHHSYKEELFKQYSQITKSTFKTFFPELSITDIDLIFEKIYSQKDDNNQSEYSEGQSSKRLFVNENIGIYSYYGAGSVNICIVPVAE